MNARAAAWRWLVPLAMIALMLGGAAHAGPDRCRSGKVSVSGADQPGLERVCAAADQALVFLARLELYPTRSIRIELVAGNLQARGHSIFGSYSARSDSIAVMTLDSILGLDERPAFHGEPFDADHYGAVIAHEVAHAVVNHNRRVSPLSNTVQEYLAYATQVALLDEVRRKRAIQAAGVGAWEPGDTITHLYMSMAPDRFAVKSYLHLTGHPEPRSLVRRLLSTSSIQVAAR